MPEAQPISHAEARILVSRAWDGEASEDDLRRLEAHIEGCPRCARSRDRMHRFLSRLDVHLRGSETPVEPRDEE